MSLFATHNIILSDTSQIRGNLIVKLLTKLTKLIEVVEKI